MNAWRSVPVLAALLLAAPVVRADRYALLVAVGDYPRQSGLAGLKYPESDITALGEVLSAGGYKVYTLSDKQVRDRQPTRENLLTELTEVARLCQPGDTLLVVLSGHGVQFRDQTATYFCPADARLGERSTLVSVDAVLGTMGQSLASHKVFLADTCRNEPFDRGTKGGGLPPEAAAVKAKAGPSVKEPPTGVVAVFGCSPGQVAFESADKLQRGVFLHHVIEGLSGKAASGGEVTLSALEAYLAREVPAFALKHHGERQVPQRVGKVPPVSLLSATREPGRPAVAGMPAPRDPAEPAVAPALVDEDVSKVAGALPEGWVGDKYAVGQEEDTHYLENGQTLEEWVESRKPAAAVALPPLPRGDFEVAVTVRLAGANHSAFAVTRPYGPSLFIAVTSKHESPACSFERLQPSKLGTVAGDQELRLILTDRTNKRPPLTIAMSHVGITQIGQSQVSRTWPTGFKPLAKNTLRIARKDKSLVVFVNDTRVSGTALPFEPGTLSLSLTPGTPVRDRTIEHLTGDDGKKMYGLFETAKIFRVRVGSPVVAQE